MQRIAIVCVATLLGAPALAAKHKLVIDGVVDDAAWAKAQVFRDFVVVEPYTLAQPTHPTEALLLSTPQGIAIAFRCSQPAGVPRLKSRTPRDADIPGDRVNVFIDFNGDGEPPTTSPSRCPTRFRTRRSPTRTTTARTGMATGSTASARPPTAGVPSS